MNCQIYLDFIFFSAYIGCCYSMFRRAVTLEQVYFLRAGSVRRGSRQECGNGFEAHEGLVNHLKAGRTG